MPKTLLLFFVLFYSVTPLHAAEKEPPQGIWQGTIANKTVVVSFNGENQGYFYTKYLKPITLATTHQDFNEWAEKVGEKTTAFWHLKSVDNDHITGTWQNIENKQSYKITLTHTKSIPRSNYFDINNLAQTYNKKLFYGKPTLFGKYQYRTIASNDHVSSIELLDDTPSIKQLNNMLKYGFQARMTEYLGCPSEADLNRGKNSTKEYYSSVTIGFWNDDWIVFNQNVSGDCGGAHPFADNNSDTVNLRNLKTIQLWNWFIDSRKKVASKQFDDDYFTMPPSEKLMNIVAKQAFNQRKAYTKNDKEKDGCLDLSIYQTDYALSIGKKGLIFSTRFPHVVYACSEDVEIPYATLIPYLNAEGKKQVDKLKASES